MTQSTCPECRRLVPAKIVADGSRVYFRKFCVEHGESMAFVRADPDGYLRALRYVKPAWEPLTFRGDAALPCPTGCGFCPRHEQHVCMPIVEITSRCDLACPVCLNSSGGQSPGRDMTVDQFDRLLDAVLAAERQIDVLNLSGGEPLMHPQLPDILDRALGRKEIVRVSLSTNGIRLLEQPELLRELRKRHVVVSLQFDGFDDAAYRILRGRPLLREKLAVLDRLAEWDITTSLVMTAGGGANDDQFPAILEYLFKTPHVVSLMIQPLAFTGRAAGLAGRIGRLTIPDIVRLLGSAGHSAVREEDFVPLPCSHPLCFALAFYLMTDEGRAVSVNRLADASTLLDTLSNRTVFGLDPEEHERVRGLVYDLWSGPAGAVPDSEAVLKTLRGVLRDLSTAACGCFDARKVFTTMERRVKSIFIHAFQDAETFDLDRVRRCCQAYPQTDGRLLPACVRNVLRAGGAPAVPRKDAG